MSLPSVNDVQQVDPVLTNMLLAYFNADSRFVAGQVFPSVPVDKDSGTYYIMDKKYTMLDDMQRRAPGQQYARGGFGLSTATYTTQQWALSIPLADEIRANSQVPGDLEEAAVRTLAHASLIRKERQWATDFMVTSVWATDGSVGNKWSDYAASDPVANILTAKRGISQASAVTPNTIVVGEIVRDRLVNHPDIIDRIKYTGAASMMAVDNALASVFGIERFLVATSIYNSANEGQTGTYSAVIDDDALIMHVAPNPGLFTLSAGYTFTWAPGGGVGTVMRNRDELNDADVVKSKEQWDQKAVDTGCGYFYADCVD